MYGNYPALYNFILESRKNGRTASSGIYLVGGMVVISSSRDFLKMIANTLIVYMTRAMKKRFESLLPAEQAQAQLTYNSLMADFLQPGTENPTNGAMETLTKSLEGAIKIKSFVISDDIVEEFYGTVFDRILGFVGTGTMFKFVSKMDFINTGTNVNEYYRALTGYVHNQARDELRKRYKRQVKFVNPVNEEGESMLDNMTDSDSPYGGAREDRAEDFKKSLIEAWEDVQGAFQKSMSRIAAYMVKDAATIAPRSEWAGWDKEEEEKTRESLDKAQGMWEDLFTEMLNFIDRNMVRAPKPQSHAKLRGVILDKIPHKQLATRAQKVFESAMTEMAKKTLLHGQSGPKEQMIVDYLTGIQSRYVDDLEDFQSQVASRTATAATVAEDLLMTLVNNNLNFWTGDPKIMGMVKDIVVKLFQETYEKQLNIE